MVKDELKYYNNNYERVFNFFDNENIFTKSRKQIEKEYNIKSSTFISDINKLCDELGIDLNTIRITKGNRYNIPIITEPLFKIMILNCINNPIYEDRDISFKDILHYNESIFEEIDRLPNELKYYIKNTMSYRYNTNLNTLVPILVDKLEYLLKIVLSKDNIETGNGIVSLIKCIDEWIYIIENRKSVKSNLYIDDNIRNMQDSTNCIIDSAIKSCYNNEVGLVKIIESKLAKSNKNYKVNLPEYNREEIIKWIYSDKGKSKFTNKDLEKRKIITDKKLKELENEYIKNINKFNNLRLENRLKKKIKRLDINPITPKKLEKCNSDIVRYINDIIKETGSFKYSDQYFQKIYIMLSNNGIDKDLLINKSGNLYAYLKWIMLNIEKKQNYKDISIDLNLVFQNVLNEEQRKEIEILKKELKRLRNSNGNKTNPNINKYINMVIGECLKELYENDKRYLKENVYNIKSISYK